MKSFEYILFDLDGTITDSAKGITDSVKNTLLKKWVRKYRPMKRFAAL